MHRTILNLARSVIFADIRLRASTSTSGARCVVCGVRAKQEPHALKPKSIVFYGSQCYVYRDPRKNSLAQRSHIGTIIGISNETKGYKAWLRNEGKVIVTQHVKRIKTMTETQNAQLQCAIDSDDRAEAAEETAQEIDEHKARQTHGTGGATKRAQAAVRQEEPEAGEDVVSAAFKRDPQNYAKAMRSTSETAR
uniref:Retroviral polymerase SH3-like domain-containing protein n=1 Tax=Peronospora matthiolae TaxID=2874970 RepID=A0AAV1TDP0_9STRA